MPGGDGRGPAGVGPRSGRGLGYCNGYDSPGFTKPGPGMGRGFRRGYGPGRGMRRGRFAGQARGGYAPNYGPNFNPQTEYTKENEIDDLKNYAKNMKRELEDVMERIEALENNE